MKRRNNTEAGGATSRRHQIRRLNDTLRRTGLGGRILITSGIASLGDETIVQILRAVAAFDAFGCDNDPYGGHDFGRVEACGATVFFKIDYLDSEMRAHSPDPTDPNVTRRVMTLMLAEEY